MSSALDIFTKFVNSPGGVLTAGAALAGIVWKFFERVEAVLTDQTKFEIAVWLVDAKVEGRVQSWPDTFAKIFERLFGKRQFGWQCILTSALTSSILGIAGYLYVTSVHMAKIVTLKWGGVYGELTPKAQPIESLGWDYQPLILIVLMNVMASYIALFETRIILSVMKRVRSQIALVALLLVDLLLTISGPSLVYSFIKTSGIGLEPRLKSLYFNIGLLDGTTFSAGEFLAAIFSVERVWVLYPALFTSIWLWLYVGSGFILRAARRFDIGFDWFNRKFDVEKKPLQSLGLVAGAIVAVVYWTVAGVSRLL